jgi:hypothetical protein
LSSTKRKEYIKAVAKIGTWEQLLDTTFYNWKDQNTHVAESQRGKFTVRSKHYSLPEEVAPHQDAVFHTSQVPPIIHTKYPRKQTDPKRATFAPNMDKLKKAVDQIQEENLELSLNVVTIFYLNQYYEIPDNIGYTTGTQAVFETASEQYSQSDLTAFQQNYNITQQTAEDVNGFETDDCSASSGNCDEGNLDIQYIMVSTFATFPSLPYMF